MDAADYVGLYKLARLALLALGLAALALWLFKGSRRDRLEAPARRMLEDDEP